MRETGIQIGVDIGGTFTDLIGAYGDTFLTAKIPSTPKDPAQAVFQGVEVLLKEAGLSPQHLDRLVHGTTVATNAAIERKGARVGLITTAGFEDVIEIGRLERSNIYDLALEAETPTFVVPRRARIGIEERLAADGSVITPLNEEAVFKAIDQLVDVHKIDALAIGFLFSFLNPKHEQRARELIRGRYSSMPISISSDIDPRFREYERITTTLFDAYLRPLVTEYLGRLEKGITKDGQSQLYVMQSSGGLCSVRQATAKAVSLLKSGLAGGVNGACDVAAAAGYQNIISIDIGGTSCDVALVSGGSPIVRTENKLQTFPLRIPMIDVNTIGAGGGRIAWLDAANGLHIGPHSAGSEPGPVCYGRGGTEATVTDASVVLGYFNPDYFAGGRLKLDVAAAEEAVDRLARKLGLTTADAAWGIHRIVNAAMTDEIRKVSLQRGEDPRKYALVLLGGAGPVHGCEVARDLGIGTLLVPPLPGLLAAYGLLVSKVSHDQMHPYHKRLRDTEVEAFAALCSRLDQVGRKILVDDGAPESETSVSFSAQMRYVGQSFELSVNFPPLRCDAFIVSLGKAFEERHQRVYGRISPERDIEFVSLKVTHAWKQPRPPLMKTPKTGSLGAARLGTRMVFLPHLRAYVDIPFYSRPHLAVGTEFSGPCIVEQADTTTVIPADASVKVDASGSLIISLGRISQ
jgi:N-methylhydantoinase A